MIGELQHAMSVGRPGSIAFLHSLKALGPLHAELSEIKAREKAAREATAPGTEDDIIEAFRLDWQKLPARVRDRIRLVIEEEG